MRRRQAAVTRTEAERAAHIGCQLRGCTCQPDITVSHDPDGTTHVRIAHDDWCPVINPAGTIPPQD